MFQIKAEGKCGDGGCDIGACDCRYAVGVAGGGGRGGENPATKDERTDGGGGECRLAAACEVDFGWRCRQGDEYPAPAEHRGGEYGIGKMWVWGAGEEVSGHGQR